MPNVILLREGELAELWKMRGNGDAVAVSFGPGGVWLTEPYEDRDIRKICELRGIPYKGPEPTSRQDEQGDAE